MTGRALYAARLGLREQRRRPLLVALLVGLPFYFISRAIAVTAPVPRTLTLPGGAPFESTMRDVHGAVMALITVSLLVALCGVFLMLSAREADRRLVVAGLSPAEAITARLLVLLAATGIVVTVSVGVTALSFSARQWVAFAAATALVGLEYGALGALAGAALGRLAATYLMFFGPMVDLGIAQNPMFGDGIPDGWARLLPGWGPTRVAIDAAFSPNFHAGAELTVAGVWVAGLLVLLAFVLRRTLRASR